MIRQYRKKRGYCLDTLLFIQEQIIYFIIVYYDVLEESGIGILAPIQMPFNCNGLWITASLG